MIAQARRALQLQLDEGAPGDPAGQRAALLRLVREEAARLHRRKAGHDRREAADRAELADRLAVDTTPEGERMRRYQLDFDRKLHRALNTLLKLRRGEGVGVGGDPAPDGAPEPEPEPVGTVDLQNGPVDGPEGEADAEFQPETEGHSLEDDNSVAGRSPRRGPGLVSFAPPGPFVVASSEEPHPIPRNEPTTPAAGNPIPQPDPGPPAHGAGIPRNEPSRSVGGDPSSQNEPTGSGRIADPSRPALVCALVILLTTGLSAAFAGPIGKPYYPGDGDPHRPDTSPQRQRVNSGDDHRFTRWRLGLVGEILPRRGDIPADGRSGPAAAKVDSDRPRRFESADRRRRPELIVRRIHAPPIGPRHPIRPWGT